MVRAVTSQREGQPEPSGPGAASSTRLVGAAAHRPAAPVGQEPPRLRRPGRGRRPLPRHVAAHAAGAFGVFCLAASGTYFVNDTLDAEADRHHPVKRLRPVAAGVVPAGLAAVGGRRPPGRSPSAWPGGWPGATWPWSSPSTWRSPPRTRCASSTSPWWTWPVSRGVRAPGHRRGRRHRGPPVGLVHHRVVVRVAPHRDGQAQRRARRAGRAPGRAPPDPGRLPRGVPALGAPAGRGGDGEPPTACGPSNARPRSAAATTRSGSSCRSSRS